MQRLMGGLTRQTGKASRSLQSGLRPLLRTTAIVVGRLVWPREISARDTMYAAILLLPWGSHTVPVIAAALLLLLLLPLGGLVIHGFGGGGGGSAHDGRAEGSLYDMRTTIDQRCVYSWRHRPLASGARRARLVVGMHVCSMDGYWRLVNNKQKLVGPDCGGCRNAHPFPCQPAEPASTAPRGNRRGKRKARYRWIAPVCSDRSARAGF